LKKISVEQRIPALKASGAGPVDSLPGLNPQKKNRGRQDPVQKRDGTSQETLRLNSIFCSSQETVNAPTRGALPFFVAGAGYLRQLQPLRNRSNSHFDCAVQVTICTSQQIPGGCHPPLSTMLSFSLSHSVNSFPSSQLFDDFCIHPIDLRFS